MKNYRRMEFKKLESEVIRQMVQSKIDQLSKTSENSNGSEQLIFDLSERSSLVIREVLNQSVLTSQRKERNGLSISSTISPSKWNRKQRFSNYHVDKIMNRSFFDLVKLFLVNKISLLRRREIV